MTTISQELGGGSRRKRRIWMGGHFSPRGKYICDATQLLLRGNIKVPGIWKKGKETSTTSGVKPRNRTSRGLIWVCTKKAFMGLDYLEAVDNNIRRVPKGGGD